MLRRSFFIAFALMFSVQLAAAAAPAPSDAPSGGGSSSKPKAYADFIKDAAIQNGLFPIITKDDKVYLAISTSQLGKQFIETSVPSTGFGGLGPAPGEPYVAPARMIEFDRVGEKVVMRWPNTYFTAQPDSPRAAGVAESFPNSVIAVEPVIAEDFNGVVVSASPFLGDVAYLAAVFQQEIDSPEHGYRLDPDRSFFARTAAFPTNDLLEVSQTWQSENPNLIDNTPDARSLEVRMEYNLIAPPGGGYMPRIADDRVGYFTLPQLDFGTDQRPMRQTYYLSRWNFAPATPGKPSQATRPLVFTLSKDVPVEYRPAIKDALLIWNDAFRRVGILNAVQVQDQPDDPAWDPQDMRHNMVRWFDSSLPQYGAEALIVNDPRTGEEINVGINIDSVVGVGGNSLYTYFVAPTRGIPDDPAARRRFVMDDMKSLVLHESGHDMGFQHNFIGSMAYTAKDLQSTAFTGRMGVATSVMEYAPVNLWPKGTPQGEYWQIVLGPYDYRAIEYGYGYIAGAQTPEQELPALRRIASQWANPLYRFASDEDVGFVSGHAIDPRVQQDDLTNDPLGWCGVQMHSEHGVMDVVGRRFPRFEQPNDDARIAFGVPLRQYVRCATMTAHVIGGEYLSRNRNGDPNAASPLSYVPRSDETRAWQQLDQYLFSDAAWRFNPGVLTRLTYSEQSSLGNYGTWAYNPPDRHDLDVVGIAATAQDQSLSEFFAPLTLQRIDDLQTKYGPGKTMTIADLFDWAQASIYGDVANGRAASDGVVLRNLQARYARRLGALWTSPAPGTPDDARALARLKLEDLRHDVHGALGRSGLDEVTRAHLEELDAIASQALSAQAVVKP
jgi:uncharacterized protein DUF4953/uncharacterized protein DUF5117/uncharacterized protein DUF5118